MKKAVVLGLFLILGAMLVAGHGEEEFAQAEEIIKQRIPCDELTEYQLEILGDYFMEQMHPGELHEIMDERMGGEGSESLKLAHIRMGEAFYCGEHDRLSRGMMNTVMGRGTMFGGTGAYYQQPNYLFLLQAITVVLIIVVLGIVLMARRSPQGRKNGKRR